MHFDRCAPTSARSGLPELNTEIQRENEEDRRRDDSRGVYALTQRPERVAYAVDCFDHDPHPRQPPGGWPLASHRPHETPDAEPDDGDVEEDERDRAIGWDQAGDKPRRRERLPQPAD